jgi:hypothetical protein
MGYIMFVCVFSSSLVVWVKRRYQMSNLLISRSFCKWETIIRLRYSWKFFPKHVDVHLDILQYIVVPSGNYNSLHELPCVVISVPDHPLQGWGRPSPTLVPWRQGFRLQQGTSVGVGLPKPLYSGHLVITISFI